MAEINVTPLVDVMLVLLVIFMVTAPMMEQGLDIALPEAQGRDITRDEPPVNIEVRRDRTIWLDGVEVSRAELGKGLKGLASANPEIVLRADKDVPYGLVAFVIGEIKASGIDKLGMATSPINVGE